MKTKDDLIDWLRDAYAMEKAMEMALKKQINNDKLPLEAREAASIHYSETEGHAEAVHACLHELGADTSTLKNVMAQGLEFAKGAGTMLAKDEHIKDILAAYAAEHFEIACYTALKAAAEEAGVAEIVRTCDAILQDEINMAKNLEANLPSLVKSYLKSK